MILRAKYVLDADLRPIENGFVRVSPHHIIAVGNSLPTDDLNVIDCGNAVLMHGLVNAHTHLELGTLHNTVQPTHDFVGWLERLATIMRSMNTDREDIKLAVRNGLQRSLESGVTHVGDISRFASITRETSAGIRSRPNVTSYAEVLGSMSIEPDQLLDQSADLHRLPTALVQGISPHATYSVPHGFMLKCAVVAAATRAPVCIHAAESLEEEEFLLRGTGRLREFLESMGVCDSSHKPIGVRPIEFLNRTFSLKPNTLLAHCNYVNIDEIRLIATEKTSVVYCPRTHHAFGHPPHRFDDMLDAGVNVCLGTDSLASNPSLSMLDEIRFLRRHRTDVSSETILRMATVNGEIALRAKGETHLSLIGSRADLIAIPIDPNGSSDPCENILTNTHVPTHCMVAGQLLINLTA
ncbi:MAG: amidohydrolase family protein [Phycisphaerales bacterium]|nr:amidohydrolase family protein [Phycisphaerales bacterium]